MEGHTNQPVVLLVASRAAQVLEHSAGLAADYRDTRVQTNGYNGYNGVTGNRQASPRSQYSRKIKARPGIEETRPQWKVE
eukprot:1138208-Pelagomonas_calceolata.AAC.1